jgi:hypothetical protein
MPLGQYRTATESVHQSRRTENVAVVRSWHDDHPGLLVIRERCNVAVRWQSLFAIDLPRQFFDLYRTMPARKSMRQVWLVFHRNVDFEPTTT